MSSAPVGGDDDYVSGTIRARITVKKKPKGEEDELPPGWFSKQAVPPAPHKAEGGPIFIPKDIAEQKGRLPKKYIEDRAAEMQRSLPLPLPGGLPVEEAGSHPPTGPGYRKAIEKLAKEAAKQAKEAARAAKAAEKAAMISKQSQERGWLDAVRKSDIAMRAAEKRSAREEKAEAAGETRARASWEQAAKRTDMAMRAAEAASAREDRAEAQAEKKAQQSWEKAAKRAEKMRATVERQDAAAAAAEEKAAALAAAEREAARLRSPGVLQQRQASMPGGYPTNVPRAGGVGASRMAVAAPAVEPKRGGIDLATGAFADPDLRAKFQQASREAVAEAIADPEGFFKKLAKGSLRGDSMLRKIRTKTQRLNVYGVWFLETVQQNPAHSIAKFVLNSVRGLGPWGMAFSAAIATAVSAVFVVQQTLKNFSTKGLPANIDYHRSVVQETVGLFTLEEQKRRDLGLAGVIVDPVYGYKPVDGTEVYNTREVADSIRLTKLTQEEKARRLY